ncbi:hypothetical protein ACET3Z_026102 [Daucus carota]
MPCKPEVGPDFYLKYLFSKKWKKYASVVNFYMISTGAVMQFFPEIGVKSLAHIYNAVLIRRSLKICQKRLLG